MEKQIQIPGQAEIAAHLSGMIPFETIAYRDQSKTKANLFLPCMLIWKRPILWCMKTWKNK